MKSSNRLKKLKANEYKIWLKKNPLTVWMVRKGMSQMEVAARLGVSTYGIYLWQHGTSVPSPQNFEKLKKLTRIDDIILQWANWKDSFSLKGGGDELSDDG